MIGCRRHARPAIHAPDLAAPRPISRPPGRSSMRDIVVAMQSSRIREVANAALKNPDVLAFWFGESDEVTPPAVREAAAGSLERGETFYGHNLGLAELREALASYMSGFHPGRYTDRIA